MKNLLCKTIVDPLFGTLSYSKITRESWIGKTFFHPLKKDIKIYIFDIDGEVSREHHKFYSDFQINYEIIWKDIEKLIEEFSTSEKLLFERRKKWKPISLIGVTFPFVRELQNKDFDWDIYYFHEQKQSSFVIEMKNWKPIDCDLEG